MALTRDQVLHIAKLARLGLSDDDVERYRAQLSQILDHFQALGEVDTADLPPTANSLPLQNVMREDVDRPSLSAEAIVANAPDVEDGFVRIRAVLE